MEKRYTVEVAHAAGIKLAEARQLLRTLRESGFVPGAGKPLSSQHIARILLALNFSPFKDIAARVTRLRMLPLSSPCSLPATAETMLMRIVETIPRSPVIGDLDVDDGSLHITDDSVALEALTLSGKRAVVRYGASAPAGMARVITIPISTIRNMAEAIRNKT